MSATLPRAACVSPGFCGRRFRGFTLIEVMVALVVSAIGLLGLAKMESLAISSSSVAGSRSLAAIQAQSLAAAMHANTGYWASTPPTSTTVATVAGASGLPVITSSDGSLATPIASCFATGTSSCAPNVMAAFDLQQWGTAVQILLPGSFSTVTCTATSPVTCTIQIQWTEKGIAANAQQSAIGALQAPTYILYVQP